MIYDASQLVGHDLETHLVQPGLLVPPIVCAAYCGQASHVLDGGSALDYLEELLKTNAVITGANIAYDLACIVNERPHLFPLIFKAFEEGRIYDVQIAEQLNAIGHGQLGIDPRNGRPIKPEPGKKKGGYSLNYCVDLRLGRQDAKENSFWRLRYAILQRIPIELWPPDAVQYPKDDVRNPVEVAQRQIELTAQGEFMNLSNMLEQVDTAFCLHLSAAWGFRTDRSRYNALVKMVDDTRGETIARFQAVGFIRENEKEDEGSIKRAVALAYGVNPESKCSRCAGSGKVQSTSASALKSKKPKYINCKVDPEVGGCDATGLDLDSAPGLPRTDTGGVSTSRDTLVESGDEVLMAYSENEGAKLRDTYLPYIAEGLDIPIIARPNVLVESGRTSYQGVLQLLPKQVLCLYCRGHKCDRCGGKEGKGTVSGVRECHCARPGCVYCSVDFSALELCTLSQVTLWLFGYSEMARIINESKDPGALHLALAADLLGKTFEEAQVLYKAKDAQMLMARFGAKAGNFGFGGGMGAAKLVLNKRSKREGTTPSLDGQIIYPGIRFCILLGGDHRCGLEKITEWKGRTYPPVCKRCVEIVEFELRPRWFKKFEEVKDYHKWCGELVDDGGTAPCFRPCWECNGQKCKACDFRGWAVERWRGGMDFSALANNGFQALASDGAKCGYRELTRECYGYRGRETPLYGSRPLGLFHDEIISELPIDRSHEAAYRKSSIMIAGMKRYVPDVWIKAEPALMKFMCKDAEPKFENGRLVPWDVPLEQIIASW